MISHEKIKKLEYFSPLDTGFAEHILDISGNNDPCLFFTAALLSSNTRRGHICLDLERISGTHFYTDSETKEKLFYPGYDAWMKSLDEKVTGKPGDYKPLIVDKKRLYLYRYWEYQNNVYNFIRKRIKGIKEVDQSIREDLESLFSDSGEEFDWQKFAAFTALLKRFCVITGGPGTGKTTTVTKVMALLISSALKEGKEDLRIALCAPTGKAAARLSESVTNAKRKISFPEKIKSMIPDEVLTIHRLLGSIDRSPYFRHGKDNLLPYDVIIVDEASMVDLALVAKLTSAVPEDGSFILVGDKNQLSSVEAGAVLNDICGGVSTFTYTGEFRIKAHEILGSEPESDLFSTKESEMFESIAELKKSYRFGDKNGIGMVSRLVNDGMGDEALKVMLKRSYKNINWLRYPVLKEIPRFLKEPVMKGYEKYFSLDFREPEKALEYFDSFRVLCVLKEGPFGVKAVNAIIEHYLGIDNVSKEGFYPGRPVMITRNDYHTGLFNGDTGITVIDENGDLKVVFKGTDDSIKRFHVSAVPEHETVYCMTVHKSQGSEFDRVLIVTPDKDSQVYTREVVYTAVTRARKDVEIAGVEKTFIEAVARRIKRSSGLKELLWGEI